MKKNSYRLIGFFGVIVSIAIVILAIVLIAGQNRNTGRVEWTNTMDTQTSTNEMTKVFGFGGDEPVELVVQLAGDFKLHPGDPQQIVAQGDRDSLDEIDIQMLSGKVIIGTNNSGIFGRSMNYRFDVAADNLSSLVIEGAGDFSISGYSVPEFVVIIRGAANVRFMNGSVENLRIISEGAGHIDASNIEVRNAHVEIDGASMVNLNMNGGILEGSISGLGSIRYSGNVENEDIHISGLGSVDRQ